MVQPPYVSEKYDPCYVEDIYHCEQQIGYIIPIKDEYIKDYPIAINKYDKQLIIDALRFARENFSFFNKWREEKYYGY